MIIIPKEHCQDIDDCLALSKLEIHSGHNELENRKVQYEAKGLTSCTKYRAIVRSKNSGTGAVCESWLLMRALTIYMLQVEWMVLLLWHRQFSGPCLSWGHHLVWIGSQWDQAVISCNWDGVIKTSSVLGPTLSKCVNQARQRIVQLKWSLLRAKGS